MAGHVTRTNLGPQKRQLGEQESSAVEPTIADRTENGPDRSRALSSRHPRPQAAFISQPRELPDRPILPRISTLSPRTAFSMNAARQFRDWCTQKGVHETFRLVSSLPASGRRPAKMKSRAIAQGISCFYFSLVAETVAS
jgi:hypothetical protein